MISDEDKERVRQATDFVQLVSETVELRQRGQEFWGCCPFHGEKTPSFKVNPATGLWHCFGCGEGGDVFSYVQRRENLEFPDAIRYLADRAGIELTEERGGHTRWAITVGGGRLNLYFGGSELPEGSDGSPHAASARSMQSARINAKYFFIVYPPFHFSRFYQLLIKGYTIFVQIALAAIDLFYCLFLTQRVFLPASYQNIA